MDHWLGKSIPPAEVRRGIQDDFWRNIQVHKPFPWRGMGESLLLHTAVLALIYSVSLWPRGGVHFAKPQLRRVGKGLQLSLYLPELRGAPVRRAEGGKADPVPARQEIRSVPEDADNQQQTIVAPPKLKLLSEVELPNLVVFEPQMPSQAPSIVQAQPRRAPSRMQPEEVQPAPKLAAPRRRGVPDLAEFLPPRSEPALVAPPMGEPEAPRVKKAPPSIVQQQPGRAPSRAKPADVQPAPKLAAPRQEGGAELAQMLPSASVPALPNAAPEIVQSQPRSAPSRPQPQEAQSAPQLDTNRQQRPPEFAQFISRPSNPALPAKQAATDTPSIVALSKQPREVAAPVKIPEGNRRGTFAASPTGRAGATGAPGAGDASGVGARSTATGVNAPAGIIVEAPPVSGPLPDAPSALVSKRGEEPGAETQPTLRASLRPPTMPAIPPSQPVERDNNRAQNELENHVFAGRRAYTLVANVPNLNSSMGSWIIRYVERKQGLVAEPIVAPEVLHMSDPAYPGELIKDGIEGTVVLTATIGTDGTVSKIAVAKSLYPLLDQNAIEALSHWIFRPALKDGEAIDLEAVITVPFRARRLRY